MQALYFFKFWTHNTTSPSSPSTHFESPTEATITTMVNDLELEGDDSFIELELTPTPTPNLDINPRNIKYNNNAADIMCSYRFEFEPNHSKRKILPIIEPLSKPNSPLSLLKSAPKLRVLSFNKCRSIVEREETKEKKKVEPILRRDNSLRKFILEDPLMASSSKEDEEEEECSKLGKYLKTVRLFHVKVFRKEKNMRGLYGKVSSSFGSPSPKSSPLTVGSKRRRFGKDKSPAPVGRRDDSLVVQSDGIQSAILHCKKSFNSTCEDEH